MKILRLRLQNLNSLKGEHRLDLTNEPLASAGLFAITGPTGAGKTTLLDAITLALYGRAARYGDESNPEHVMSRHCGECSAEVEFEVPSGIYRAVWERHRAGKKAGGRLQQPKRYIYDAAGQPLAQQIREAEDKIEELLGLNYDRFLRSALLAQGDFARFLKAKADERAELLESLTGTVVYSRLGKLAHDETNRREADFRIKDASHKQIAILDDGVREELKIIIETGEKQRELLTKEIEAGAAMRDKINALEGARKKEKNAADEHASVENDLKTAAEDLERLRQHRLTVPFAADLARLESAESARMVATKNSEAAKKEYAGAVNALARSNRILRAATENALAACRDKGKTAGETAAREAKEAAEARVWLDEHQKDASLTDQLGEVVAAIGELKTSRTSLSNTWATWRRSATDILSEAAGRLPEKLDSMKESKLEPILESFLGEANNSGNALEAGEKEARKQYDLRRDHLEKATLVAKLEDHRHTLKSGEECPLCGALEHPYAEKGAPGSELSELAAEVEKASEKLQAAKDSYRTLASTLKTLRGDQVAIFEGVRNTAASRDELRRLLQPLGTEVPAFGSEDTLRAEFQGRERAYRIHAKTESDARKRHAEAEYTSKEAAREAEALRKRIEKLPPLASNAEVEPLAPHNLPSVPDAEDDYNKAVTHERTTATQVADRKQDEEDAVKNLGDLKQPLEASVAASEFETLDRLRAARLENNEAKRIEELDADLKRRTTAAGALLKQARNEIQKLLEEKVLEGVNADSFKEKQGKLKEDRDELVGAQATRCNQMKTDDENRKQRKEKEEELQANRKKLVVWQRLRDLIGSHDGSKFRRYAQAISLDILTRHANRHLTRLSDRYRIRRDEAETLNLQVEDLYQADAKRPMASLSGGESFLVSLALALGLSDLAGRTVRIDSLFIDEGFGSLDSEALEVAISALESLRQDHKTVGVISHVALLKERIGTQIFVEKKTGGVSQFRVVCDGLTA